MVVKGNPIANRVNSFFLDSPYEGKDWEKVRVALIQELNNLAEFGDPKEDISGQRLLKAYEKAVEIFYEGNDMYEEEIVKAVCEGFASLSNLMAAVLNGTRS